MTASFGGGWVEQVEVRAEVLADEMDRPELYDLRCGSGVVPCDDGVTLLRGIMDGLPGLDRRQPVSSGADSAGGGGGVFSMDSRFSRLASVGLMVLAARPEACGMVEILREAVEPGAPIFLLVFGDLGDLGANPTAARWSGYRDG